MAPWVLCSVGRIGYVLFITFLRWPLPRCIYCASGKAVWLFMGALGCACGNAAVCTQDHRSFISITDFLAPLCPIGLGLGRLGNFINMELPGRVSESGLVWSTPVRWSTPSVHVCRYLGICGAASFTFVSGVFEGAVLFILLWLVSRKQRPAGFVSALFLCGYGGFRLLTELFREPDAHIGFVLFGGVSMGQLLSLPLLIAGILLGLWSLQNARKAAA
ncbi:MAG: hypothetical protein CM15mP120_06640 [Pseudomonadota bacterium]|nr:MAG: hypothetical protein CM15mP120_06640 [Pseudomonadota bacterium]